MHKTFSRLYLAMHSNFLTYMLRKSTHISCLIHCFKNIVSTVIQGKYLHTFFKHTLNISITFVDSRSSNPPHLRKGKPHTPHLPASAHPSQQTGRSRVGQLRSKQMSFVIIEQKAVANEK